MAAVKVWAGPILRRLTPERLTFWLATDAPVRPDLTLTPQDGAAIRLSQHHLKAGHTELKAGAKLYFQLLDIQLPAALPTQQPIYYQLLLNGESWQQWAPDLCFTDQPEPFFVLQPDVRQLLHGSCRKPHHPAADGLLQVEQLLAETAPEQWPALLMLSGDQIYADDVATPMLIAIHQLLPQLGLPDEALPCSEVASAGELHQRQPYYLRREALLPDNKLSRDMVTKVFGGVRKPVFTSDSAHNHLISLGEVLAMYLLVWSPQPWQQVLASGGWPAAPELDAQLQQQYQQQQQILQQFVDGLPRVRRALAHLPVAMIFDDHDITDDWNLTAAWEQAAYNHDFSARIIGNALLGYLMCQGWGNCPEAFSADLLQQVQQVLAQPGQNLHDKLLQQLFRFNQWQYQWPTEPPLLVLDTRTQRWRSERSLESPSGLMDWEAITDLQQRLLGLEAVILVSPAPIFGVKLIESIQRVFAWCGKPLLVDAENWMAHPGAAHAMLNLFRHPKTPRHFVILSGDVHYSFVYDIRLRGKRRGPDLWQITSSGLKNEFPKKLLDVFDRLNRWLYSPRSPLNWFTRRRRMQVIPHKPETADPGERLLNASGVGLVTLNTDGSPREVMQLCADGRKIRFVLREEEGRWE